MTKNDKKKIMALLNEKVDIYNRISKKTATEKVTDYLSQTVEVERMIQLNMLKQFILDLASLDDSITAFFEPTFESTGTKEIAYTVAYFIY